jgi:hypothetical protein
MKLFNCVCDGGHLLLLRLVLLLLLLLVLLLVLVLLVLQLLLKEIMIQKIRMIWVRLQGLEVIAVFQESEVVGLLEWTEGKAKTHWIVHYQMATNWMWWIGVVFLLLFYQMAKSLPVCF